MKRAWLLPILLTMTLSACHDHGSTWFKGDYEAAKAAATERDTMIMLDFYTDWCTWCKRLEKDTFPHPAVQAELAQLVAMRVNAEKGGEDLAKSLGVDGYPTIIFVTNTGEEVDRIPGFLPPEEFASRVQRIRTGDTFAACLKRLDEDPADFDVLERGVSGLLKRSDVGGAISRLEAFDAASPEHGQETCRRLMFKARTELHSAFYRKMAKIYRTDGERYPDVPTTIGTSQLRALIDGDYAALEADQQAARLRESRGADAQQILIIVDGLELDPETAFSAGHFAYVNGQTDVAEQFYRVWFEDETSSKNSNNLNMVAWRLYLMGQTPQLAVEIAREAYAMDESPDVADTLARALYLSGETEEAIALQLNAAETSEGDNGEQLAEAARRMQAGEDLGDQPPYELFPGTREG